MSLLTYANFLRKNLPVGTTVPAAADPAFFAADQQYVALLQKKMNDFLAAPGVRQLMGNMPNLEVDGRYGPEEHAFALKFNEIGGNLDGILRNSSRGVTGNTAQITEMKKLFNPGLVTVDIFHFAPDSDYQRIKA